MTSNIRRAIHWRADVERGAVGGLEMLPLGFLVFVVSSIMIINAWTAVDAWFAVSTAAREGARVYVESDPNDAWPRTQERIIDVMHNHGRAARIAPLAAPSASFERCEVVTVRVGYELAFISLPFLDDFGSLTTIEAAHSERIDPYRSGDFEGGC